MTTLENAWFSASKAGYHEDIAELIERKVDPNIVDALGSTGLHYAAGGGHPKCTKHILGMPNVNVNAINKAGDTPLHKAVAKTHKGTLECVELLIAAGANTALTNKAGQLAKDIAKGDDVKASLVPVGIVEGYDPDDEPDPNASDDDSDSDTD
mmetsp:Transcript_15644/g.17389  ORF Transcript_15644/g.17389 Transcript_15644/m.17389 type:complete len:153 (+) Transcript_15644:41-499(+)|eukprot:CAMPEP_0168528758 /NCGR_PEP_ID=MMETSP0405-20121227/13449_1 /TAXON_ID=498012 /ORGANISM="Trichosphaerium sp, Strain Am-I-7 wt" /LENGTH=152 /DNA_ID=CAMNT_0008552243 /DNA_START=8 /DNA_END=466 /DNA_ORIENTATION=+